MTPEESKPLDELLDSEENHSIAPSSSSSTNGQIRVKNVSEINSNEAEANPSPPTKRKLPSWMLVIPQQNDSTSNKKRKTVSQNIQCASTSSAVDQPGSSVSPSTSGSNEMPQTEKDVPCSAPTSSLNGGSDGIAEVTTNGEAVANNEMIANGVSDNNGAVDTNNEANLSSADVKNGEADDSPRSPTPIGASTSNGQSSSSMAAVKTEPNDNEDDSGAVGELIPASTKDIKPAAKVEKEEATSSTSRVTCKFGIRCYRQNPNHRMEEAHPGDKDYERPNFPSPPNGTPSCPYGNLCYRRNPVHFQQFSHPPSTDFQQNWKNHKMRLRQRKQPANDPSSSFSDLDDEDDYDIDDPFINDDSEDEFIPDDGDDDEEDDYL